MDGWIVFARWRQCAPNPTHASLGTPKSKSQTAYRSVQPFLGRPFVKRFALCYQTALLSCLSCPVCSVCLSLTLVYCGQTVVWIKLKLGMEVGLEPGHIVLDQGPAPSPPKRAQPQFSAHVRCGQTAGWIKTPLGMEVGLDPGDYVLDGDPAAQRGTAPDLQPPIFGPYLLWPNGRPSQLLLSSCCPAHGRAPFPPQYCLFT